MPGPITVPALSSQINTQIASGQPGGLTALQMRNVLQDMNVQREYFVTPQMYGAVGNGVADDTVAIQACVTAANGTVPIFISSIFGITATINTPANTAFFGRGDKLSGFKVLGSSVVAPIFLDLNGGNVQFYNLGFFGNNSTGGTAGANVGGAFWMSCSLTSGPAFLYGPKIINCYIENFAIDVWLKIAVTPDGTIPIQNPVIDNNRFMSFSGNDTGPASIGINSTCISLQGAQNNLSGQVVNAQVTNNYANCVGLKGFCFCFANTKDNLIAYNTILDPGNLANNNVGSYGIAFYNDYGSAYGPYDPVYSNFLLARPTGKIIGNTINGARDTAIYSPHGLDLQILDNRIDATLNASPVSLTIGGIAISGGENVLIDDNSIRNIAPGAGILCAGIWASAIGTQGVTIGDGNRIVNSNAAATGITISAQTSGSDTQGPSWIGDVRIDMTGANSYGIVLLGGVGFGFSMSQMYIGSPVINATRTGIFGFDGGSGGFGASLLIIGNPSILSFTIAGIDFNSATGRIEIDNPDIDCAGGGIGMYLAAALDVSTKCPTFRNATAAYAFQTDSSSKGTVQDAVFRGCTAALRANVLGTAAPTFTYDAGSFVKNLTPTIIGTTPNSYFVDGWKNITGGSTWVEVRTGLI